MKISAISNQNFMGKEAGVKIVGELSTYPREMLNRCYGQVESFAKNYGRQVKIAEKGKSLIINSGTITTSFSPEKLGNPEVEFAERIINNIRANTIADEKTLKTGLNFLV
jgi:hypothetical protein